MTDNQQRRWLDEAEDALKRAGDALKAAWDQTRDSRMAALETAKEAANRLGEAIDQGIEVAKETWDPGKDQTSAESPGPVESTDASVHEEE
jgi:hypothetical protein